MDQNIKLVLKYLKEHDLIESFLTLERQTEVKYMNYTKEIQFFKKIMLKGDFNEAINFVFTFENRMDQKDLKKILLDISRQRLYELIQNPNEEELKNIFEKELINYCTEEEFQELFTYLTYRSVNEIQGFEKWSVIKGRYECFQGIIPYLQLFNSIVKNEETEDKLEDIIEYYNKSKSSLKSEMNYLPKKLPQVDYLKQTFQKNKSINNYSNVLQNSMEEELDRKNTKKQQENADKQKETIKNSIINMNLSNNYSQIKNKINNSNLIINQNKKNNYSSSEENNQSKITEKNTSQIDKNYTNAEKNISQVQSSSQVNPNVNNTSLIANSQFGSQFQKSSVYPQKSSVYPQKSGVFPQKSSIFLQKSGVYPQKRPRVNASLNGPMNRQKIEGSLKIDNFMKDSYSNSQAQNMQASAKSNKGEKVQKSQLVNQSNLNSYSQMSKSKQYGKSSYSNRQQENPPVGLTHFNQLQSSQLNQISEEDQSETAKSVKMQKSDKPDKQKFSYLLRSKQEQDIQQQVKKNIQYLQQTSSVIYKNKEELQQQNFTFSNQPQVQKDHETVKKIVKLAVINDSKAIRICQFSQTGNYFAVGTNSSILKIFDVQRLFAKNTLQQLQPIYQIDNLHQKSIFCLNWSNHERNLVTCSNDLNIKLTQINKGFTQHKTTIIGKHDSCVRMVKFNSSQNKIISCGDDSTIKVWDLGKVKKCTTLKSHTSSVSAFKMQNENELYSVSKDSTIKKWDLRINQNVATSKAQQSQLTYIANNTDKIIVSHKNGNVSFFNSSLVLEHAVQIHEQQIRSVQALRGENTLLTASFDGHVALFTEYNCHSPNYFQHNDSGDDKVVYATFLHSAHFKGFSSTSTLGLCHIYSYQ